MRSISISHQFPNSLIHFLTDFHLLTNETFRISRQWDRKNTEPVAGYAAIGLSGHLVNYLPIKILVLDHTIILRIKNSDLLGMLRIYKLY